MLEKIIPHLYSRMEREDYSDESIKFFLSVLEKWLTRHIIGHDREIVQKALSDAAGEDGAQPEMKTAAGNLPALPVRQGPSFLPRKAEEAQDTGGAFSCWP